MRNGIGVNDDGLCVPPQRVQSTMRPVRNTRVPPTNTMRLVQRVVQHETTAAVAPGLGKPSAETERRLLVVSYHFPPDNAIGGLRWSGLTKYLSGHGWRSWVVTGAPQPASVPDGVVVASRPRWPTLNDGYRLLLNRLRRHRRQTTAAAESRPAVEPANRSWLGDVRSEAGVALSLPDEARGWVLRAAWTTWRFIGRVRPSVVVSSGPPHSAHIAVWIATRLTDTPWYVDLRDPWTGGSSNDWKDSAVYGSRLHRWCSLFFERLVLRSATRVICNTREFATALGIRYPAARIEWVPNAVDHKLLPSLIAEPFPGLSIVHTGSVYGGRDFGPVLAAAV